MRIAPPTAPIAGPATSAPIFVPVELDTPEVVPVAETAEPEACVEAAAVASLTVTPLSIVVTY